MTSSGLHQFLGGWAAAAMHAAQRFPPPDFESGHSLPETAAPAPDAAWLGTLDVAVLAAALGVASYLVLARRSRRGVFALAVFSLLYFGFWREGCVCAIGSVQNVALALADPTYALPAAVAAFFVMPLVAALLFGRTFCAGVCPLGAIQELVILKPLRVPAWVDRPLGLLRHVYLALAVLLAATGSAFVICEYDPFVGFFRMNASLGMVLFGAALLALGMFVARPYCRYLCPYSVLLGWLSLGAKWHARIDPDQCVNCHLCADSCPVGAIRRSSEMDGSAESPRRRVALALLAAPLLIALGAAVGAGAGGQLARLHATVGVAERVAAEQAGVVSGVTDASEAFRAGGESIGSLYSRAEMVRGRFAWATPLTGAFVGLILAAAWVRNVLDRRRREYEIDRDLCVSCARCFAHCPHDAANLARLPDGPVVAVTVSARPRRRAAIGVGAVAAALCVLIAAVLLFNHRQMTINDPLDAPAMVELRRQLHEKPNDEALKQEIRAADAAMRADLLYRRSLQSRGAWLLLVGVAAMVAAFKVAGRVAPAPSVPLTALTDAQRRADLARGRWATAFVALGLVSVAVPAAFRPAAALVPAVGAPPAAAALDPVWPTFRGPGGSGVCADADRFDYPRAWDASNVLWKSPIALPGKNSPVVAGDRVFCTGSDGRRQEVYCFDADTGRLRWSAAVAAARGGESPEVMDDTGFAAPTTATDGQRVYAMFAAGDVAAFDLDGKPAWSRSLGLPESTYGYASSLALAGETLIIQFDQGQAEDGLSSLIALDGATGKVKWEVERPVGASWSSPIVVDDGDGRPWILTLATPLVIAHDAADGAELWRCEVMGSDVAPSPVRCGKLAYVVSPNDRLMAIPVGRRGTVAEDDLAWTYDGVAPDITSPLCDGKFVYVLSTFGDLASVEGSTGREMWTHKFNGASFHASPMLIGGVLHLTATSGVTHHVRAGEAFELMGESDLGERVEASLAPARGRILVRGEKHLYCIGRSEP